MNNLYESFRRKLKQKLPLAIAVSLILGLLVAYLWDRIVIVVYSGESGVLYRPFLGGTVEFEPVPEGLHLVFPWNKVYIYDVRLQQVAETFRTLSKDGLTVTVDASIRFRPQTELLGVLHKNLGPNYLDLLIVPEVAQVLRITIGRLTAEEVYMTQGTFLEDAVTNSIMEVSERYVMLDEVLVKEVSLPEPVQRAIEEKIRRKHMVQEYEFRVQVEDLEAERRRVEAAGLRDYNQIIASSVTPEILRFKGIEATLKLSESANSKVVVIGAGKDGLPLILGADR